MRGAVGHLTTVIPSLRALSTMVITGLDPVIQKTPLRQPELRKKMRNISKLLDCRVKPGNDGAERGSSRA